MNEACGATTTITYHIARCAPHCIGSLFVLAHRTKPSFNHVSSTLANSLSYRQTTISLNGTRSVSEQLSPITITHTTANTHTTTSNARPSYIPSSIQAKFKEFHFVLNARGPARRTHCNDITLNICATFHFLIDARTHRAAFRHTFMGIDFTLHNSHNRHKEPLLGMRLVNWCRTHACRPFEAHHQTRQQKGSN